MVGIVYYPSTTSLVEEVKKKVFLSYSTDCDY